MKYIRECRMGNPKQFKTGAVVGTYPKPLLYLGFDRGGLDVVPTVPGTTGTIPMDVVYGDIVFIPPSALPEWVKKPQSEQPKILAVDFTTSATKSLTPDFKPEASQAAYQDFIRAYNSICSQTQLPWKTVCCDSITGFTDVVLSAISSVNPSAMADARQWAGMAGAAVRKTILSMTQLPAHVVILLHSFIDKNDLTGEITEKPNVYSQVLRDDFFGLFSQCFYSVKVNGVPRLWVSDKYPVKGIGPRWPQGLPQEMAPDFNSIYGKEGLE